jgi:hypothetical protein
VDVAAAAVELQFQIGLLEPGSFGVSGLNPHTQIAIGGSGFGQVPHQPYAVPVGLEAEVGGGG